MRAVGIVLQVAAVVCGLMGLLWIGQGLGLIHWPASSFMLDQRPWAVRGVMLSALAIVLGLVGGRLARR